MEKEDKKKIRNIVEDYKGSELSKKEKKLLNTVLKALTRPQVPTMIGIEDEFFEGLKEDGDTDE
jgi:hypothetical protein